MAKSRLSSIPTAELRRELERRQRDVERMLAKRNELASTLANLEQEISALGVSASGAAPAPPRRRRGRPPGRKRGRPAGRRGPGRPSGRRGPGRPRGRATGRLKGGRGAAKTRATNTLTLTQALQKALRGRTLGVSEVMGTVQAQGYVTNAANFRTIVNQALSKNAKLFKKVSRGKYTAA